MTESQIKYSSTDTKLVEDIYNLLPKEVFDNNSYRLAIESLKVALEMQNKGMPVNHESLLKIKRQLLKEKKMVETKLPPGLNVDSPKQVKEYLNIESSAKGELFKLKDTRSEVILKAREINKALTFVDLFDNKKFIYSFTNPTGAKTGRATSKGCDLFDDYTNLQQIPRDLKSVFGVRNGAFYITADYPALEIRTTCAVFDDDFLYDALKNNKNLHNETCLKLYGKGKSEISERQYVAAKSCNFSLMYGAGPKGLYDIFWTRGFETTEQECYDLVNKWWGIYKGISQTRLDAIQYFKTHSFSITRTPLGYPIKNRSFTEHLASVPQGAGAECTKMAMYLLKKEYGIIPVNAVHDSIVAVASSYKEAEDFAKGIKWAMEEGFRRITRNCLHNDIPCEVDVYIGEDYK